MELGLVNVGLPAATAQSALKPPCGSRRVAGCVFCVIGNAPELAPEIVYRDGLDFDRQFSDLDPFGVGNVTFR